MWGEGTIFNYNFRVELLFHSVEPGQVSDLTLPWQNLSLLQSSGSHVSLMPVRQEQTQAITHPHKQRRPASLTPAEHCALHSLLYLVVSLASSLLLSSPLLTTLQVPFLGAVLPWGV